MSDTETMPIEDYLDQGGVLTSPVNAPARYRGELLRLMATFVDSELAGLRRLRRHASTTRPASPPGSPPPASRWRRPTTPSAS